MRVSDAVENKGKGVGLSRRKLEKKNRGFISGLMVGPIDPKCWEAPEPY